MVYMYFNTGLYLNISYSYFVENIFIVVDFIKQGIIMLEKWMDHLTFPEHNDPW